MMRRLTLLVLGIAALSIWACSSQKTAESTSTPAAELPHFETSDTVTAQVQVLGIDKTSRLATLKGEMGDTVTVQVSPEVKNFDQLAAGDLIDIVYTSVLSIRVEPPGEMTTSASGTMTTASPGEQPHGSYSEKLETKATITAIDKAAGTATLTGPAGNTLTVTPQVPENLDKVKVGDMVVFTHTQEIALSVQVKKKPS